MGAIIGWLQGKKSYIVAAAAAIFNFGLAVGWWTVDNQVWLAIDSIFAALFGMALRAGVSKVANGQ